MKSKTMRGDKVEMAVEVFSDGVDMPYADAIRALYEKHGYVQAGLRRNYYEHPREDAVIMTREFDHETANSEL